MQVEHLEQSSDKVETEGTEVKNTTFKILPEVGYELNEDWSVGTVVGYEYNKSGDVKTNTFTIAHMRVISF